MSKPGEDPLAKVRPSRRNEQALGRRIAVIGCGGAGKTTLALELGARLKLPVHHLDRLYWGPGWTPVPRDEFIRLEKQIRALPEWILDGNYGSTMASRLEAADTILFLDLPTGTCLWGAVRRYFRYLGRSRPDMTDGNTESIDFEYLTYILTFRRLRRPGIRDRLARLPASKSVVVLTSRNQVRSFLDQASSR